MMTKNIRKVVSIICALAVLMSVCVVSMVGTTSAFAPSDTPVGGTLKLDFENKTGISDGWTKNVDTLYVTDPADPENTVVKLYGNTNAGINVEIGNEGCNTFDGSDAFVLQPNTKYVISFKFKFGAGSYGCGADTITANRLPIALYSGTQSAYSPSAPKSQLHVQDYTVDPATNPETTVVGKNGTTVNILAADTEWQTFTYYLTTGATVAKDNLYINMPVNPQTAPYGKMTCYLDDILIDIIDENDPLDNLNNEYVFNFKEDSTNTYWNPLNHSLLSNSDASRGKKSYVGAEGLYFTPSNQCAASAQSTWRHKSFVYDQDHGGFFQIKPEASYIVTLKYKLLEKGAGTAVIGLGVTAAGGTDPTIRPDLAGGGMHMLAGISTESFAKYTKTTDDWQYLTVAFDADGREESWLAILGHGDSGNTHKWLVESVTIREVRNTAGEATVTFNTNGGDSIDGDIFVAGTPTAELPTPTNSNPDKGFAGWYLDAGLTVPVGETLAEGTYTIYAKWVSEYVNITFNNSGKINTVKLANGAALSTPTRPNSKMFFEGWYTDLTFTNKVTKAPENDCTLYAKYNYTYIGFSNGGATAHSYAGTGIITEPDNPDNKVLNLKTVKGASHNFELGNYDAVKPLVYEMPKTNTTYYIEYKIKIPAGSTAGKVDMYTGEQSEYSLDHSKTYISGLSYSWSNDTGAKGTDWITVSGYYTVGDTFYRERVNFSVQDQFYFVAVGLGEGTVNSSAIGVYIDDIFVGEYSEEVPEGAVGVYFETNAEKIAPIFGYAGDALVMPEDPKMGGYEFLGWYTDMNFRHKFEATTFGEATVTLYAKWKSVPAKIDFENFEMHETTSTRFNYTEKKGNHYIRYNYEQGTSTSPAATVARVFLNNGGAMYRVLDGAAYTIKLKYYVEETTGNATIKPVLHNKGGTWGQSKEQGGTITLSTATDGWQEGEIKFIAHCEAPEANYLSIGVGGDSTVYIDDIVIESSVNIANIYGSSIIFFDAGNDISIDPVSGNPGDEIYLPTPKRAGYKFGGWYNEGALINKFTDKTFGEEDITLYASWILGKFEEGFENFPVSAEMGVASAYELYRAENPDVTYDAANVQKGVASIFRDGTKNGDRGFTICRDSGLTLGVGQRYTLTFWVKPTNVTNESGLINLIQMSSNTSVGAPDATEAVVEVGKLTVGEWQKVTYTFTATEQFIGIQTSQGNDIYFDNFEVTLKGYTGTATGDNTVSPIIVMMMVLLAAGAMVLTGKKVFSK